MISFESRCYSINGRHTSPPLQIMLNELFPEREYCYHTDSTVLKKGKNKLNLPIHMIFH